MIVFLRLSIFLLCRSGNGLSDLLGKGFTVGSFLDLMLMVPGIQGMAEKLRFVIITVLSAGKSVFLPLSELPRFMGAVILTL